MSQDWIIFKTLKRIHIRVEHPWMQTIFKWREHYNSLASALKFKRPQVGKSGNNDSALTTTKLTSLLVAFRDIHGSAYNPQLKSKSSSQALR